MSMELQGFKFTAVAGEDLSAKQYHFMKMSADLTVVTCTGLGSLPVGVLQNSPPQYGAAEVMVFGITKIVASGAITFGVLVGTDANGHAISVDPAAANSYYYVGQMCISTGGASEVGSILVDCSHGRIQSKS